MCDDEVDCIKFTFASKLKQKVTQGKQKNKQELLKQTPQNTTTLKDFHKDRLVKRFLVGKTGGICVTQGIALSIPDGALDEETWIYLAVSRNKEDKPNSKQFGNIKAPIVICGPSGIKFKKPAYLLVPHSMIVPLKIDKKTSSKVLVSESKLGEKDNWKIHTGNYAIARSVVLFEVNHFTKFALSHETQYNSMKIITSLQKDETEPVKEPVENGAATLDVPNRLGSKTILKVWLINDIASNEKEVLEQIKVNKHATRECTIIYNEKTNEDLKIEVKGIETPTLVTKEMIYNNGSGAISPMCFNVSHLKEDYEIKITYGKQVQKLVLQNTRDDSAFMDEEQNDSQNRKGQVLEQSDENTTIAAVNTQNAALNTHTADNLTCQDYNRMVSDHRDPGFNLEYSSYEHIEEQLTKCIQQGTVLPQNIPLALIEKLLPHMHKDIITAVALHCNIPFQDDLTGDIVLNMYERTYGATIQKLIQLFQQVVAPKLVRICQEYMEENL